MGNKLAHLQMIQSIVTRMARNSFLIKGWCVVLVSALFALAGGVTNIYFVYIAFFPALAFWILDGYFLWQERLFRALYDHVREQKEEEVDFAMDTSIAKGKAKGWLKVAFSKTLSIFHLTIILSIVIAIVAMIIIK